MNYTIADGFLVTSSPEIGVLFLGNRLVHVRYEDNGSWYAFQGLGSIGCDEWIDIEMGDAISEIRIPLSLVGEIIKPVEGEACLWAFTLEEWRLPIYTKYIEATMKHDHVVVKPNAITLNQKVGELCTLMAAVEEAMK
jgi:hypothetical protein